MFEKCWQFPNCLGGLDGKHVKIYPLANSGSLYHNFKGGFSVVLMALVDANLEFIYVDAGQCRHLVELCPQPVDGTRSSPHPTAPGTSRYRCKESLGDHRRQGVPPHRELALAVQLLQVLCEGECPVSYDHVWTLYMAEISCQRSVRTKFDPATDSITLYCLSFLPPYIQFQGFKTSTSQH